MFVHQRRKVGAFYLVRVAENGHKTCCGHKLCSEVVMLSEVFVCVCVCVSINTIPLEWLIISI